MEALKLSDFTKLRKEPRLLQIAIDHIRPNPYQPRRYFQQGPLRELAASIEEYGVLQPITVRRLNPNMYELVSGERRWRAAGMAGLLTIPSILVRASEQESAILAFVENLQRQNLNFMEEAEGYRNMMDDYELTQEELASRLNRSQSAIANKLRLLKLGMGAREKLMKYGLTERHGRAILKIPDGTVQEEILEQVYEKDLTVKQTEDLVEKQLQKMISEKVVQRGKPREKRLVTDIRLFTNSIDQSVNIIRKAGMKVEYEKKQMGDICEISICIKQDQSGKY